jgi:hypothetical protein
MPDNSVPCFPALAVYLKQLCAAFDAYFKQLPPDLPLRAQQTLEQYQRYAPNATTMEAMQRGIRHLHALDRQLALRFPHSAPPVAPAAAHEQETQPPTASTGKVEAAAAVVAHAPAPLCTRCRKRRVTDRRHRRQRKDGRFYWRGTMSELCDACRKTRDREGTKVRQQNHRNSQKERRRPTSDVLIEIAEAQRAGTRRITW